MKNFSVTKFHQEKKITGTAGNKKVNGQLYGEALKAA
jgi:hypothetical protein